MNNIIFSTDDGKTIKVNFKTENYEYSTDSLSIDTSSFIKALAESGIDEEIQINDQSIIDYMLGNEVSDEFNELYKFVTNIPKEYNKAVKEILELN